MASPVSASAVATATSAENPELDACGLVMPKLNSPASAAAANSAHVGCLASQPRRLALSSQTPNAMGLVAIFVSPSSLSVAPMRLT